MNPLYTARIDVEESKILSFISEENKIGQFLQYTPVYEQIREARRHDDLLSVGVWETPRKKAQWQDVERLTAQALSYESKDFQLLAWLCESWSVMDSFEGIRRGLTLLSQFLTVFQEEFYPQDKEHRDHILEWLEQRLVTQIHVSPLVQDTNLNTWKTSSSIEKEKIEKHIFRNIDKEKSTEIFNKINSLCFELKLSKIQQCINEIINILNTRYKKIDQQDPPINQEPLEEKIEKKEISNRDNISRQKAFQELRKLQSFFRENDPHSPLSYVLELLVHWEEKNLLQIIQDLQKGTTDGHGLLRFLISGTQS